MFGRLRPLEENGDPGAMGFKKGYSVAELAFDFRLLRDRAMESGGTFWTAQMGFAVA